jgi:taurine transport system permease protein
VRARVASGVAWFVLPFLVLLVIWYMAVEVTDVPERVFPQVTSVWGAFVALLADGTLWEHVSASLRRVFVGALIGIVTAVPFGLAMGVNRYVSTFFTPILRFSVALAGIAWIPLATLWFGYGEGAVTFIIWNAVFFSLVYNTMQGVSQISGDLHRAAMSLGADRVRMIWEVLVPGAMPAIVTGMRVGMGYAWRGLIAAEIIASSAGLGYLLFLSRRFYRTETIIMSMVIIGLIWLVLDRLALAPFERRTIERWGMKKGAA